MVQFLPLPDSDSRKAATFDDVIEVELYLTTTQRYEYSAKMICMGIHTSCMHVHMMLSCIYHDIENHQVTQLWWLLGEVLNCAVYMETKHRVYTLRSCYAHISLGTPNLCDASAGQFNN